MDILASNLREQFVTDLMSSHSDSSKRRCQISNQRIERNLPRQTNNHYLQSFLKQVFVDGHQIVR